MILDERTEFADASTDIQAATGRALIGDVINTEVARDLGNGQPVYVVISVDTEIDSAADGATVDFEVSSDAAAAIATDGTATVHVSTGVIAEAALLAGATWVLALPLEGNAYEQYLGIVANIGGETITGGAINAFLTLDPHGWQSYPDAVN